MFGNGKGKSFTKQTNYNDVAKGGSRDFEKGCALCRPPWLADKKKFGFQLV